MGPAHWDSLPLAACVDGAEHGDGLSPEQAEFLANTHRIVVLGKWVGRDRHGSSEKGNAVALRQLKAVNPDVLVCCFWAVNDQFSAFYESASRDSVPREFLLFSPGGGEHISMPHHPDIYAWDTANPALRAWWVETVVGRVLADGYDGVHVDGIKPYVLRSHVVAAALGDEVARGVAAGVDAMMADLRAALAGTGKLVLYNGIKSSHLWPDGGTRYLTAGLADGVLLESFGCGSHPSPSPAAMAADMDLVARVDGSGGTALFGSKPDSPDAFGFSLACFLCCAGENSFFRFPLPGLGLDAFAPYLRPFGTPGPVERDGTRYRREFEHASVEVDLATRAARINWV